MSQSFWKTSLFSLGTSVWLITIHNNDRHATHERFVVTNQNVVVVISANSGAEELLQVRCDAASLGVPCTNCVAFSIECKIPAPKRKKTQGRTKDSDRSELLTGLSCWMTFGGVDSDCDEPIASEESRSQSTRRP